LKYNFIIKFFAREVFASYAPKFFFLRAGGNLQKPTKAAGKGISVFARTRPPFKSLKNNNFYDGAKSAETFCAVYFKA
jgi:hypothetical protein